MKGILWFLASLVPVGLYLYGTRHFTASTQRALAYLCIPFAIILAMYSAIAVLIVIVLWFISQLTTGRVRSSDESWFVNRRIRTKTRHRS